VTEVLDELAAAYQARWRVVESEAGLGAFILLEGKEGQDDKAILEQMKQEMAREAAKQGWYIPKESEENARGFGSQYMLAYRDQSHQRLQGLEQRLEAATLARLGAGGIPFIQLPGEIQRSVGALVEAGNRKWAYSSAEQILKLLLR